MTVTGLAKPYPPFRGFVFWSLDKNVDSELVRLGWVDLKSTPGWVPWRLAINFPKPLENKISISSKISDDFAKLDRNNTPFHALEVSKDLLKGIIREYDFSHDGQAQAFLAFFMTDLRNIFWRRFGKDEAMRRFIQLTELAETYRSRGVDVDSLLVLSGIIAWDQEFRAELFEKKMDLQNDINFFKDLAKSKHQPVLVRTRVDLNQGALRTQRFIQKIERYQKEDYSPVFKQITVKLMYNSDIFPIKPICEFYEAFGIPSSLKTNYDKIVMDLYNKYLRVDFSKKIEDFYYDILSSAWHLNYDEIREINTIRNTPPERVIKREQLSGDGLETNTNVVLDANDKKASIPNRFSELENLRWDEVTITIIKNDTIQVQSREECEVFLIDNIGFKDNRSNKNKPNLSWTFLRNLAKFDNGIELPSKEKNFKANERMRHVVSALRKHLKSLMGITEDPFYSYKDFYAYKPKFKINDTTAREGPDTNELQDEMGEFYTREDYDSDPRIRYHRDDISEDKDYDSPSY